ncbi:hypothetical protein Glove_13g287 [Diversispora epigaea]|uniref:TLDc domain-containing protein n=1 Tax=Diversispora epigaea TaxID=1348612 RepID=A0A397JQE8_9GLOM|nr:hypothetical protein Glove_13g287 [Diversispora epigaea]
MTYKHICQFGKCKTRFIFDLMLVTNEFELDELTNKQETLLVDIKACLDFTSLPESALISLHKRDDLLGFAPKKFWNICHGHGKTVVVTKVKGTDEILGGYNLLTWDKTYSNFIIDNWGETMKKWKYSKLVSLKNGNIQNCILSRAKNIQRAICIRKLST